MTTKILALTDALGNLVRFVLLPGHRFDTVVRLDHHVSERLSVGATARWSQPWLKRRPK